MIFFSDGLLSLFCACGSLAASICYINSIESKAQMESFVLFCIYCHQPFWTNRCDSLVIITTCLYHTDMHLKCRMFERTSIKYHYDKGAIIYRGGGWCWKIFFFLKNPGPIFARKNI